MDRRRLLRRSLLYLVSGSVTIGTTSVVAPAHFSRHFPDEKAVLLTLCLVAGSLGGVAGILLSGARVTRTPRTRSLLSGHAGTGLFALSGVLFASLYVAVDPVLFVPLFASVHFTNQFLFNTVDQQYVRNTEPAALGTHSQIALTYQLTGLVLAPVFLALAGGSPSTGVIVGAAIVLALAWGVAPRELSPVPPATPATEESGTPHGDVPMTRQDRAFGVFYLLAYAAVMSVTSQMVFIVADHFGLENPVVSAGLLLGVSQLAAIGAVAMVSVAGARSGREPTASVRLPAAAALGFTVAATLGLARLIPSFGYLLVVAVMTGLSFGAVQLWSRTYASRQARRRPAVLTMYNNVANYGSLAAFALNLALSVAAGALGVPAVSLVLWSVVACTAGAFAVVVSMGRRYLPAGAEMVPSPAVVA